MIGFRTESVKDALGGSFKPLIDEIAKDNIRCIAAIVDIGKMAHTAKKAQGTWIVI